MITVLETALVVVVVYLVIRNVLLWHAQGSARLDSRQVAARGQEDLQRWMRTAHDLIRGRRGRIIQVVLILAIIHVAANSGFPRNLLVVGLGAAGLALFSLLKYQLSSTPTRSTGAPTPPPLPTQLFHHAPFPAPQRETPKAASQAPASAAPPQPPSRRTAGWRWVALFVLLVAGGAFLTLGVRPRQQFFFDHMPQTRAIFPEPHVVKRSIQTPEDFGADLSREIITAVQHRVHVVVRDENDRSDENGTRTFAPESVIEVPQSGKVRFTTLPFATKDEADHDLVARVARFVALSMAQAQHPVSDGGWTPELDWTARHFAHERRIIVVHDEKSNVTHFTGEVSLDVPDERAVEQVWHEYLHDQAVDRSWLVLRGYGGAVLMMGGLAIFLRLGTSRHLPAGKVSYKQRWLRRR